MHWAAGYSYGRDNQAWEQMDKMGTGGGSLASDKKRLRIEDVLGQIKEEKGC